MAKVVKEKAEPKELPPLWATYDVQWNFFTELCASVPGNPKMIDEWVKNRMPKTKPPTGKTINEIQEEVFETLAEPEAEPPISLLVFQRIKEGEGKEQDGGLVVRAATIRAHLKDCARVISAQYMGRLEGERAFSTKVINGLYIVEEECIRYLGQAWVPLYKQDNVRVKNADGNRDKAIHVRGSRGETINALKNFEYVLEGRMNFALRTLGVSIKEEDLKTLMLYGGVHGYGGERGDGAGRYSFTLKKREG
jgi:hypothetical protein